MTTDELNAIVQAVMTELEKAGVDFDFKAEVPQADDLVYVMRGTADRYMGITVKWQNLLDIIVKKATDAKDEAVSAKDIALQTLATIQGIESNISSMKSSVETSEANVASMKASVEASEENVTQIKSEVSEMKTSVEGTKTEVEGLKSDVTALKSQTQTIVDNAKEDVEGLLDTKVDKSSVLTYDNIMASTPPMDLDLAVPSASALKEIASPDLLWENANPTSSFEPQTLSNIDLSEYKEIEIWHSFITDINDNVVIQRFKNHTINNYLCNIFLNKDNTTSVTAFLNACSRKISITEDGITFEEGNMIYSGSVYAGLNGRCIPLKIYGIK